MSSKFKVQSLKFGSRDSRFLFRNKLLFSFFAFHFSLFTFSACSIPNLEKPECEASRQTIKEFYSYHFGNEMKFSQANLKLREKFLTEDLKRRLEMQPDGARDYFTATDDYPKAFRIGTCEVPAPDRTIFQIVLFWKDDNRNEQREVKVETVRQNEQWLINKIF